MEAASAVAVDFALSSDFLLRIPSNLFFGEIFSEYLEPKDLAVFEVAIANHEIKEHLQIFENVEWSGNCDFSCYTIDQCDWLCRRGIRLQQLTCKLDRQITTSIFDLNRSRTKKKKPMHRPAKIFKDLIAQSEHLKVLKLVHGELAYQDEADKFDAVVKLIVSSDEYFARPSSQIKDIEIARVSDELVDIVFETMPSVTNIHFHALTRDDYPSDDDDSESFKDYEEVLLEGEIQRPNVKEILADFGRSLALNVKICCCPNLTTLQLSDASRDMVVFSLKHCPRLMNVVIGLDFDTNVEADMLDTLFQSCPQVEQLSLKNVGTLTAEAAASLRRLMGRLKSVSINFRSEKTADLYPLLSGQTYETLEEFSVFSENQEDAAISEDLTPLLKCCPNLCKLELMGSLLSAEVLTDIGLYCQKLRTLVLVLESLKTVETIAHLLDNCPLLETLKLYGNEISPNVFVYICRNRPRRLRSVAINFLSCPAIPKRLASILTKMEVETQRVELSNLSKITIDDLSVRVRGFGRIGSVLIIGGAYMFPSKKPLAPISATTVKFLHVEGETDDVLIDFIRNIHGLQHVYFVGGIPMDTATIKQLCAAVPTLKSYNRKEVDVENDYEQLEISKLKRAFPSITFRQIFDYEADESNIR